jgi:uncharacterized membrane protein YdjX (TVP38/TMEM64 family)
MLLKGLGSRVVESQALGVFSSFVAAATPIPDEPVVIPLGLLKYSPVKFFSAFFLGKLSITVVGAFPGSWTKSTFSEWLSPEVMVALSIVLTVLITVILLKVDVNKLAERFLKRKPQPTSNTDKCLPKGQGGTYCLINW